MSKAAVFQVYGLPHCTTCQAALAWLKERGVQDEQIVFHDVKANPLSRDQIAALAQAVGGAKVLFSKRALKYRSMKLSERKLSDDDMLDLIEQEYTFITRPAIIRGEKATCGFVPKKMEALL
jgi:arsenate reductase